MLETIYNDFTTKLLPKVAEGLVVTKDYFLDLFGRYVKYLIITDTIYAFLALIFAIIGILMVRKGIQVHKKSDSDVGDEVGWIMFGAIAILFGSGVFVLSVTNLIKDVYIPEVRVLEQIKSMNNKS